MTKDPEIDIREAFLQLSKNAEAGFALVTVAVVDQWLQKLLLTKMEKISNTVAGRIFESFGPLYEIAPKADMAFALGLIDDTMLSDFRVLRDIRNKFAHADAIIYFSSEEIALLCQKLSGWKKGADNHHLFNEIATELVQKIDAKTQEITFAKAAS